MDPSYSGAVRALIEAREAVTHATGLRPPLPTAIVVTPAERRALLRTWDNSSSLYAPGPLHLVGVPLRVDYGGTGPLLDGEVRLADLLEETTR